MRIPLSDVRLVVVGLGYVGLPLAIAFAKASRFPVTGFDLNKEKIRLLREGIDPTGELGNEIIKQWPMAYSDDPSVLAHANVIIAAVPTPITPDHQPDLSFVQSASRLIGSAIRPGTIVVFESTVYPGVTEDVCAPLITEASQLQLGTDFTMGYSPERINPGDKEHTIDRVVKVVAGQDAATLETLSEVYGLICTAGIHRAPTIKTAEAAKVIENIQRDVNIALVNELSLVFKKLDIDTQDVLAAAGTKWNFHRYHPGLVGGHCIGVDPYYLTYRATQLGYTPQVILAGRKLNDDMPVIVAQQIIAALEKPEEARIGVLGLTFKENVADFRNSKSFEMIAELRRAGVTVLAHDPYSQSFGAAEEMEEAPVDIHAFQELDGVVYLVAHQELRDISLRELRSMCRGARPVLFDLKRVYDYAAAEAEGFNYLAL